MKAISEVRRPSVCCVCVYVFMHVCVCVSARMRVCVHVYQMYALLASKHLSWTDEVLKFGHLGRC